MMDIKHADITYNNKALRIYYHANVDDAKEIDSIWQLWDYVNPEDEKEILKLVEESC